MKRIQHVALFLLLGLLLGAIPVLADNRVVVIPLLGGKAKPIKHVVTVAKSGGDFTDPVAAVKSIDTRYGDVLVVMAPGVYELDKPLSVKPKIHVIGSGRDVTILTGSINSNISNDNYELVNVAGAASLENLTVSNTGTQAYSTGIRISRFGKVAQLSVRVSGAKTNYGIQSDGGSIENTLISVTGGDTAIGLQQGGKYGSINQVQVYIKGPAEARGVYFPSSFEDEYISNLDVWVKANGPSRGILIDHNTQAITLENVHVSAISTSATAYGISSI